ncbi:protease inhibitor I42 family protein [Verrucomicrobia bacterium]|nr:protease inhibitor I42 family protein [Verrucomicrobiota bacterium]
MKITKLALSLILLSFGLNLQAQEGITEGKPQPIYKAPNGKAFPANWGRPPLKQTCDLRPLPGGYGRGSGTLAGWIQGNLDKDANKNKPAIKPGIGKKAYPKHWGAPPRLQTKDLRPLPGGYGLGSSTLAGWIQRNLAKDAKDGFQSPAVGPPVPEPASPRPVAPPPVFDPNAKARELADKQAKVDTAKVKEGIKAWEVAKAKTKGNYSYKIGFQSWVGFGHETTIVVRNNKVAERHFRTFNRARPIAPPRPGGRAPAQPKTISWVETGKAIGTNKGGAPAKTLDELYKIALETAQKPLKQFERRSIRSDKQGLLVSCYIMDRRIADDAPRNGLVVSSITLSKVGTASTNQGGVTRLTAKDNGKTIKVKAGQRIEISLAGNPTTGFTWNNVTRGHGMKLLGEIAHKAGGRALGAPGMSTATFQAMELGKNELSLEYRRVFEKNPPIKTFKVTVAVAEGGTESTKPTAGNNQIRITELKKEIARMKDFARRARFTPEGLAKHNAKLAELEKDLATLQGGGGKLGNTKTYRSPSGKAFPAHWGAPPRIQTRDLRVLPGDYGRGSGTLARWIQQNLDKDAAKGEGKPGSGKQTGVPTFEEWVKGGMKIPSGRVFIGGSPWFDERKGERRSPREVYKMLYGGKNAGGGKPPVIKPRPRPNPGKGRFPAHWGAPPRIQTRDLRPLPGGYGRGSSTLAKWIQQNLAKDAANPNRSKSENTPAKPQSKRPALSPAFSAKHPGGSYATGELLVGVEKGLSKEASEKMLAKVIPGLKVKKAMINNTILHVTLPESTNVELAMAKLKTVKAVRYSELNGRVGIQPAQPGGAGIGIGQPRPQILPRTPPRKLGKPQAQPRRR